MDKAEIKAVEQSLAQEIASLIEADAEHVSAAHESDAAKRDVDGTYTYCPGCRLNVLTSRLSELRDVRDDTGAVRTLSGRQVNRLEEAYERARVQVASHERKQ